jgi:hypothetical protein
LGASVAGAIGLEGGSAIGTGVIVGGIAGAAGGAAGQAVANMIDPCHPGSIGDAAVIGGLTGFIAGGAAAGLSSGLSAGATTTAESITNVATTAETAPTATAQVVTDTGANQVPTAAETASLANVLDGHPAGQGFSGVYDASTGDVLIAPSTADSEVPEGWVPRSGGHADVSAALGGDAGNHSGFAVILQEDSSLNITWTSGTLNPPPDYVVPPDLRQTIIDAVQSATGRKVNP